MEASEFDDAVQFCLDLKSKRKDYNEIKEILRSKEVTEDEIVEIIKETDKLYLSSLIDGKKGFEFNSKWLGLTLIFIGVLITVGSIIWAEHFNGPVIIFMFGPIAAGSAIYYGGRRKQSKYFGRKQDQWNRRF